MRDRSRDARRSGVGRRDGSQAWFGLRMRRSPLRWLAAPVCAVLRGMGGIEVATSPWWQDADGVLARVRGDAAVCARLFLRRVLQFPDVDLSFWQSPRRRVDPVGGCADLLPGRPETRQRPASCGGAVRRGGLSFGIQVTSRAAVAGGFAAGGLRRGCRSMADQYELAELPRGETLLEQRRFHAAAGVAREKAERAQMLVAQGRHTQSSHPF